MQLDNEKYQIRDVVLSPEGKKKGDMADIEEEDK